MANKKAPGRKAGAKHLTLRAASKDGPQYVRTDPAKSSSPQVKARFLDVLAATCNVKMAADAVQFTPSCFYYLRRKDPAFAREWDAARGEGVARIEMELVRLAEEALTGRVSVAPAEAGADGGVGLPAPAETPACAGATAVTRLPSLTFDQAMSVVRLFRSGGYRDAGARLRHHRNWTLMDPQKARAIILRNVETVRRARLAARKAARGGKPGQGKPDQGEQRQ